MKKYTKEQILIAAEIGEVSMIDAKHVVSLLDEAVILERKRTADDENLKKVHEKYGKTHTIEVVKGTKVVLAKLAKNQSVCWGDGESYHFLLTAL